MRIAVIGGMNLDLLGFPEKPLLPRDSNPGRIVLRPGGVGRNIGARLAAMGEKVSLITALGNDERAALLESFCRDAGLDLSHAVQTAFPAPCYLCIHDADGDMISAISDMEAMTALTKEKLADRLPFINGTDACVVDANLSEEALSFLAQHVSVPIIMDPVSCAKAERARAILPRLALFKPNRMEAAALTGENDPALAAQKLLNAGVQRVFISLGAEGVYYAGLNEQGLCPAIPLPSLPLTGAGDALCAGLTRAMLLGESVKSCAEAGCRAAFEALMNGR